MQDNIAGVAQGLVDAANILIRFLRDTDPLGTVLVFIFGLWRGWWVMGPTHTEVKKRLARLESILEKLATGVQMSTAVTMGVVRRAHLADPEGNDDDVYSLPEESHSER